MLPARQGLEAQYLPRAGRNDRLVMQVQLSAFQGLAQFRLQVQLTDGMQMHALIE